ncbi:MAG TPA: hypothetical protein VE953_22480, partial [Terriglobales bacterium]|nr:hypothetical protein [Terriglobales bacterium]
VVVPQASGAVGLTVQQQTSGNVGATLFAGGDLVVGDSSHGGFAVPNLSRAYVAYTGAGQSLTANAFTQIQFGTEEKDQRSEYSSNQFQALGTGCYHAEAMLSMAAIATAGDRVVASFFKNGSEYRRFADFTGRNTTDPYSLAGAVTCDLVATDTLDVRVYCYTHGQTTANTFSATTVSWFTVSKIA